MKILLLNQVLGEYRPTGYKNWAEVFKEGYKVENVTDNGCVIVSLSGYIEIFKEENGDGTE